jgi:peptidoglycan/LPS O-acetylase OafA/YrhL
MTGTSKNHLQWLDYARFVAAMSVVAFHYLANIPRDGRIASTGVNWLIGIAEYGYLGVDIFFMISGFVITTSAANRSAIDFGKSRFVRLWPTFIICMLTTVVLRQLSGLEWLQVTTAQILVNATMIPEYFKEQPIDGVYWTLLLEIRFYAVVFCLLLLGFSKRLQIFVEAWVIALVVCAVAGWKAPLLGQYSVLFASGCVLSFIYAQGWNWRNVSALAACIPMSVISALTRGADLSARRGTDISLITIAAITVGFFALFIACRQIRVNNRSKIARSLGLVSYPLYLIHATAGIVVIRAVTAMSGSIWLALIATLSLALFYSFGVINFINAPEAKIRKYLQSSRG